MPVDNLKGSTDFPLTLDMPGGHNLPMKEPLKKRTAIFLRPDQTDQLRLLSDLTGAPWAELIRRAIDNYLESRKDEIADAKKSPTRRK
jgi:ribbon-helix-helix protein